MALINHVFCVQTIGLYIVFMLIFHPVSSIIQTEPGPIVSLPQGDILGEYVTYEDDIHLHVTKDFYVYRGIPFAEPPLGDLRFKAPEPKGRWEGLWNATYLRSGCEQTNPLIPELSVDTFSEDCLYLNVYVPVVKDSSTAVMVWIHGGGFFGGTASSPAYEPYPLLAVNDFIFVSINYRLGAYGFLYTGDDSAPGNYGMLDQVVALTWIHENIAAFGGDPNRVTVGGESAGAASTHLLTMSPLSKNLFQQAYLQSGSALSPWAVELEKDKAIAAAHGIADTLGCPNKTTAIMVNCLREVPARNITTAMMNYLLQTIYNELPWAPVVDGYFLPDKPINILRRNEFNPVNLLLGSNLDEGNLLALVANPSYFVRDRPPPMSLSDFREQAPLYVYDYYSEMTMNAIEQQYIDWSNINNRQADYLTTFAAFTTDQAFACPVDMTARAHANAGSNVYLYQMTLVPTTSMFNVAGVGPGWMGCTHAEDLQFVFGWEFNPVISDKVDQTPEEIEFGKQILKYWTNFVVSGNPNSPADSPADSPYDPWPSYTIPDLEYKTLSVNMTNGRALKASECAFWNKYIARVSTFTDDLEDVQKEWEEEIQTWREEDLPNWKEDFEEYRDGHIVKDEL